MLRFFKDLFNELKLSNWKSILLGFAICMIFNKFWEHLIDTVLINKIFIFVNQSLLTRIVIITTILVILIANFRSKKLTPSTNFFLSVTCFIVLFTYYRFISTKYTFIDYSLFGKIRYADIVLVFYFVLLYKWLRQFPYKRENIDTPIFNEDISILNDDEDQFDFKKYAKKISEKILIGTYEKSFAIGINGSWGSGKTSLLNLIINNIPKDNKYLVINFNPWSSQTPQALITDFFQLISNEITPYNKTIGKLTLQYAKKLINSNDDTIISKILGAPYQSESAKQFSDDINSSLKKLNLKLIIAIDDIDRLNKEEIAEVFKLVRNTANFHNTIFILLYDRNYVSTAIDGLNKSNSDLFMEKIIQLEISLPICEPKILNSILKKKLIKNFKNTSEEVIDKAISGFISFTNNYITDWITNTRDVNRLVNSLILNYSNLENEVDFKDFLKFEILRLKLPNVYNLIKNSQGIYLRTVDISNKRSVIEFTKVDGNDKEFLITQKACELYPDNQEKVKAFLSVLFIDKYRTRSFSELSIIYPSNLNRYFRYSVSENELSEIDFSKARINGLSEMKSKIDSWVFKGLNTELAKKFKEIHLYDSDEDYNVVIESIFYFANKPTRRFSGGYTIQGYDDYDLITKLKLHDNKNEQKHIDYFLKIINKAEKIFSQELVFLHSLIEHPGDLIISKPELEALFIEKIKSLSVGVHFEDEAFSDLYNFRFVKRWENNGSNVRTSSEELLPEIIFILRQIVEKANIDNIIRRLIRYNHRDDDEKYKQIDSGYIEVIWGNNDEFLKYLDEDKHKDSKYIAEFKELYKKCEEVNFKTYIEFPFKVIPKYERNY